MLIPKIKRHQNERHRRFIASLPCIHCGAEGASQAAHVVQRGHGKMGGKTHDYHTVPLCHVGANDCHNLLDSYKILDDSREALINIGELLYRFTGDIIKAERIVSEWTAGH